MTPQQICDLATFCGRGILRENVSPEVAEALTEVIGPPTKTRERNGYDGWEVPAAVCLEADLAYIAERERQPQPESVRSVLERGGSDDDLDCALYAWRARNQDGESRVLLLGLHPGQRGRLHAAQWRVHGCPMGGWVTGP